MPKGIVYVVSGIDTDIGKTIATGLMGRWLRLQGFTVITQKMVQTGCTELSEDILTHRELMEMELQDVDRNGSTCPYIFPEPCSPHLAAALAGKSIDCTIITRATQALRQQYQYVLLEGVGGLSVPLTEEVTVLDYLQQQGYPLVLVSSPRLGSINHTLTALELANARGIVVKGIIYNRFQEENRLIAEDSKKVFSSYLRRFGFADCLIDLSGCIDYAEGQTPAFERLFDTIHAS